MPQVEVVNTLALAVGDSTGPLPQGFDLCFRIPGWRVELGQLLELRGCVLPEKPPLAAGHRQAEVPATAPAPGDGADFFSGGRKPVPAWCQLDVVAGHRLPQCFPQLPRARRRMALPPPEQVQPSRAAPARPVHQLADQFIAERVVVGRHRQGVEHEPRPRLRPGAVGQVGEADRQAGRGRERVGDDLGGRGKRPRVQCRGGPVLHGHREQRCEFHAAAAQPRRLGCREPLRLRPGHREGHRGVVEADEAGGRDRGPIRFRVLRVLRGLRGSGLALHRVRRRRLRGGGHGRGGVGRWWFRPRGASPGRGLHGFGGWSPGPLPGLHRLDGRHRPSLRALRGGGLGVGRGFGRGSVVRAGLGFRLRIPDGRGRVRGSGCSPVAPAWLHRNQEEAARGHQACEQPVERRVAVTLVDTPRLLQQPQDRFGAGEGFGLSGPLRNLERRLCFRSELRGQRLVQLPPRPAAAGLPPAGSGGPRLSAAEPGLLPPAVGMPPRPVLPTRLDRWSSRD